MKPNLLQSLIVGMQWTANIAALKSILTKTEDNKLIKTALDGNPIARPESVNRHKATICHIIAKIIHDSEIAADLVQETFMKAFSFLAVLRPSSSWAKSLRPLWAPNRLSSDRFATRNEISAPILTYLHRGSHYWSVRVLTKQGPPFWVARSNIPAYI